MKLGVCYYPEHTDSSNWEGDARSMAEIGILYVRIAEFCWSRIEPKPKQFDFNWLDEAIRILGNAGLKVILCTPTATPPKWLIDQAPSILPVGADGNTRKFGSRRHYSFSSEIYLDESKRITQIFAERYGENPNVAGWQTDNEYGCHDTIFCYSEESLKAFRIWLRKKYSTIENLNRAWGNVFWSMEYVDFDQIELPNQTVTEPNPSHSLDFYRFSSDQVVKYNRAQTEIIRQYSPNRPITHNSMGFFFDYDHYALSRDLDFMSWDNYPLGFLAESKTFSEEDKKKYLRTGHPDIGPFHHDLYRSQSVEKKFWIMEQQPGPVNWAPYNPIPEPKILRQWIYQGFAHGAETVSCFRWRQCAYAQEQEHAGLNYNHSRQLTPFGKEFAEVGREIPEIKKYVREKKEVPAVGLIFDYESIQRIRIQPQGKDFDPVSMYMNFYLAVRRLGLNVDILPVSAPVENYDLLLIPCLPYANRQFADKILNHTGKIIAGPRLFSKTEDFQIPENSAPLYVNEFFENKILFPESLPAFVKEKLHDKTRQKTWEFSVWRETFRNHAESELTFSDGSPACLQKDSFSYLGFFPEVDFLTDFIGRNLPEALKPYSMKLPAGIRRRFYCNLIFYFNTAEKNFRIPLQPGDRILIGKQDLARNEVTILASEIDTQNSQV